MLDILKKFNAVEQKTKITECGSMPSSAPSTPVSVNLSAPTAQDMAQMLRALANIESGEKPAMAAMPMAMAADAMEAEYETDEAFVNEPDEEYADHNFMTKDLSGGINRQKTMYKPAAKGDNPMAVESIKDRLYHALNEKKAKPDFLDMDKDGNKKEPMKKAIADKKKKAPFKEAAKPDYIDLDKDGNKKEPMKKAAKDAKKKAPVKEGAAPYAPVSEISPDLAKRYTKRAKMDRDFNDDDLNRLPSKVRHGTDDEARQASDDMMRLQRRNSKRQTGINRAAKRM